MNPHKVGKRRHGTDHNGNVGLDVTSTVALMPSSASIVCSRMKKDSHADVHGTEQPRLITLIRIFDYQQFDLVDQCYYTCCNSPVDLVSIDTTKCNRGHVTHRSAVENRKRSCLLFLGSRLSLAIMGSGRTNAKISRATDAAPWIGPHRRKSRPLEGLLSLTNTSSQDSPGCGASIAIDIGMLGAFVMNVKNRPTQIAMWTARV